MKPGPGPYYLLERPGDPAAADDALNDLWRVIGAHSGPDRRSLPRNLNEGLKARRAPFQTPKGGGASLLGGRLAIVE